MTNFFMYLKLWFFLIKSFINESNILKACLSNLNSP
jgi:hypothetical protein